jgi:hypothetical protein
VFPVSDGRSPWDAPDVPLSGNDGHRERAGCAGWIVLVFLASSWFGASVVFHLYALVGFNPDGSALKEANGRGVLLLWLSLMALMLVLSVYFWSDRRRFRNWVVSLVLMATCPVWFPFFYALVIGIIAAATARGG